MLDRENPYFSAADSKPAFSALVRSLSCSTLVSSFIGGGVAKGLLRGPFSPRGKTVEAFLEEMVFEAGGRVGFWVAMERMRSGEKVGGGGFSLLLTVEVMNDADDADDNPLLLPPNAMALTSIFFFFFFHTFVNWARVYLEDHTLSMIDFIE